MKNSMFTPEELAELAAFDAEIDASDLDAQDYRDCAQRDKEAVMAEKSADHRKRAKQIAAYQREYREANKDQIAAYQREYREANKDQIAAKKREYYEANKDQIAAYQREYYEANPQKYEQHKAYMRAYAKRKYLEKKMMQHDPICTN